jgi:ABC-type transporter Mla subunit MlaD
MTRTISDSARLVIAKLNRTETELKQAKDTIEQFTRQLKAQTQYITELKDANKMLAAQVKYLVSKQINHA